jgi:hypothetical protein
MISTYFLRVMNTNVDICNQDSFSTYALADPSYSEMLLKSSSQNTNGNVILSKANLISKFKTLGGKCDANSISVYELVGGVYRVKPLTFRDPVSISTDGDIVIDYKLEVV